MQADGLIARFIVRFPDDPSAGRLFAAWDERDAAAAFEGAHALKGVCANLGLDALSAEASALCELLRPGTPGTADDPECAQHVEAIRAAHGRAVEAIRVFAAEQ